jgi:N12 class adenine-specific DNA methylase/adenine-specific DNA methylase
MFLENSETAAVEPASDGGSCTQIDMFSSHISNQSISAGVGSSPAAAADPIVAVVPQTIDTSRNYYSAAPRALAPSWQGRALANIEAITLSDAITAEGREATRAEQAKLALFTGFGASELANNCFRDPKNDEFRKGWETIGGTLESAVSKEDHSSLSRSTQYAHYTPESLVHAIWYAVTRMGFKGGNVLEPGMGTGLFLTHMPKQFHDKVRLTGVEADPVTGRIARLLHPDADVRIEDYGLTRLPRHFSLAIGNPPFSARVVRSDSAYRRMGLMLHDFFIVKSLDHVRAGGIGAFITSQGTMDKMTSRVREQIALTSDLVGAIRMPQGTFKNTAGTDVGVDILFFRKRHEGEDSNGVAWTNAVPATTPGHEEISINEYFLANPEMVLGKHTVGRGIYGPKLTYICKPDPSRPLGTALKAAILSLPQDICDCDCSLSALDAPIGVEIESNDNQRLREGSYFVGTNGELMQVIEGRAQTVLVKQKRGDAGIFGKHAGLIRALIPIRDAVRAILSKQERFESSIEEQINLNELYDAFVAKHGYINHTDVNVQVDDESGERKEVHRQPNLAPFRDDPDCWLVASIEEYDLEAGTARKGLIFDKVVIAREVEPEIASAADALARCLNEYGRVDVAYIASLLNKSEAGTLEELGTTLYFDPATDAWQTQDEYLSGNVRKKLLEATAAAEANPTYGRNVEALEQVQPTDIPPSDITARLGAPWIPTGVIEKFSAEIIKVPTKVRHTPRLALWTIEEYRFKYATSANTEWGTLRYDAGKVLLDALNSRIPAIYDEDEEGSRVLNAKETEAAKEKLQSMKNAFEDWVWRDGTRADELARLYNDNYNNLVNRRFDGSHLKLPGAVSTFKFYQHQKNAIWRMISAGSTYVAHAVGAGKTASIAAAIMEQRRLGLVSKAVLTVPGHCLAQCAREFLALYPLAKILVADEQNFARDKRRRFLARAATGDWDCIIITHSAFKFIPLPVDFEADMMERMVDEYEALIKALDNDDRLTRKRLERMKETFKGRLEALKARKDDFLTISEIGIDKIVVDEAQEFRKLSFSTNMSSLKGVDPNGSQMAWDLYCKAEFVRYIRRQMSGEKRVHVDRALDLASGTPITNTLGEMYSVQRFMDEGALTDRDLGEFDSWASAFGNTRTELELQPSGKYKPVTRFSEFVNVPELIAMFRSFADVVSSEDLRSYVKRPNILSGKRQIITSPPSADFKAYQKELEARIKKIEERRGSPKKGDDILLSVITDGRHAAIDLRFVMPGAENDNDNKLNKLIANVFRIYKESSDTVYLQPDGTPYDRRGGTQMIFSDLGTMSVEKTRGFSAYRWIRDSLIALGIPSEEIAIVHDYNGSQAKNRLFADMRAGKVRITLGSTKKMGTGVNAQNRLIGLHHLDVPWLPSDIEQREGRIDRQGNQNEWIGIYAYATEQSVDATQWQGNERKAKFITAALSGDRSIRRLEDVGEDAVNQFAMAKAIASGDPRLMQKAGLESEVSRLQRLRDAHYNEQHTIRSRIRSYERDIANSEREVEDYTRDLKTRGPMTTPFEIKIGGMTFMDKKEAGKALKEAMGDIEKRCVFGDGIKHRKIGEIRGFDIEYSARVFTNEILSELEIVTDTKRFETRAHANTQGAVICNQLEERLSGFEYSLNKYRGIIEFSQDQIAQLTPRLGSTFAFDGELLAKRAELEAIDADLARDKEAEEAAASAEAAKAAEADNVGYQALAA